VQVTPGTGFTAAASPPPTGESKHWKDAARSPDEIVQEMLGEADIAPSRPDHVEVVDDSSTDIEPEWEPFYRKHAADVIPTSTADKSSADREVERFRRLLEETAACREHVRYLSSVRPEHHMNAVTLSFDRQRSLELVYRHDSAHRNLAHVRKGLLLAALAWTVMLLASLPFNKSSSIRTGACMVRMPRFEVHHDTRFRSLC